EISREPRQPIVLTVSPTIIEADILTLDDTGFVETSTDDCNERRVDIGRTTAEQSDHRLGRLLRARREWPRRRRAAEQRYEVAPLHSITSSARLRSIGGMSNTFLGDSIFGDHTDVEFEAEARSLRYAHHAILDGRTVDPHPLPNGITFRVGKALDAGAVGNRRHQMLRDLRLLVMCHCHACRRT